MTKQLSEQLRVLIIDDDQKILDLLNELLKPEGYDVELAADGQIGWELVQSFNPDLVISDVVMPVMGGIELCRRLKADVKTAPIPILLISGLLKSSENSLMGLSAGADDYLDLPFRNEEVLVKVARLTERHRAEKHYREIVEQAADIIYTRSMSGYITSINSAGSAFFGRPVQELVGAHLSDLIGTEAAARDIEATKRLDGRSTRALYHLIDAQGVWRYLEAVITVVRDQNGQASGVRGVVRDITEQKHAEQALKESEERYRRLVELSPEAIVVHSDGKFDFVNPAALRLWGASRPEQLIGRPILDMVHPDYREITKERVDRIAKHGVATDLTEQKFLKLSGEIVDVEIMGMPFIYEGRPAVQAVIRDITDRKREHDELRLTEERLSTVICSASLVLFVVDQSGIITLSEGKGLELLGRKPGEVVGRSVYEVYRDAAQVGQNIRRALAGEGFTADVELGDVVFDTRYSPLRDDSGAVVGVIGVAFDVTDSRRAERDLQENEARYKDLFENANDIIYTHDLLGNFTSLNRSGEQITGYSRQEALSLNIADVLAPEYVGLARQMIARKTFERFPTVCELEIVTKQGRHVRLEVSTQLIYRNGQAVGILGIGRDLTERKRSEDALRESQSFFHSFMNNSPAVAFLKDREGRYVYVNQPFERMFGKELTSLRGRTSFDWLQHDIAEQVHKHDLQVLENAMSEEIIETLPGQDGQPHHWLMFKFPMNDVAGNRFVGGVGVDITERQQAEEALAQQAEREAMTHRISQAIRCSLDSREIFGTAVRELGSHLNVDRCSLFIKDEGTQRAINVAEYHVESVSPAAHDFDLVELNELVKQLNENGVLVFHDVASDERISDVYERVLAKADVRSIMYVAIKVGEDVPAAFALSTTRGMRTWSSSDIKLAKAVADQTGIAIRQAELYQKSQATSTREVLVNRLTMTIRASLSLPEVLSTATRELGCALSASRVHLHLFNPENPVSPLEHEYVGAGCSSINHLQVSYEDPIGAYLLNSLQPIIINDSLSYSGGTADFSACVRENARALNVRSQIDYPLVVKGVFRGVLCIHQTERLRHWTTDDIELVGAVAERLSIGIAQAELFEIVARAKGEWETTFDSMSDGVFIFDSSRRLKRVNRAGAAMEHTHPRDLLGRRCCDILRTDNECQCVVERALEEARSLTIEITPAHFQRQLLVSIEPVLNEGKVVAVVCTARDISELRDAQAVAREHQSLLANILESARESIYALDTEGRFKWCNSATVKGLGITREEFVGRKLVEMVYEGDRELVAEKLQTALGGQAQTYEMRYVAQDGRLRYARVDNSPLIVEGYTTGVLGLARDITVQKEERERAARADKLRALGQLASGVAHDFNNSLAAILGRAQLLRRQIQNDALLRNLDIIQTAAEDAAATVRRIQTFARKSPAKEFEVVDVRQLLQDAIEITRTRWQNDARLRGLDYQVHLNAENEGRANGSASELREVFVNLIVNAVDAMPEGGRLSISCIHDGPRLKLQFADTGTGMPEETRQKIFDPFFTTKGAHGTGLGLSVSYSIIERHEGSISVISDVGRGSIFTIELPALEEDSVVETAPAEDQLQVAPLQILVIDDEPAVRETLADMLRELDHNVVLAESGHEALREVTLKEFDLIFTDLAMPEMDGWETAREIRKRQSEINIVLVTGYGPGTVPPAGEEGLIDAVIGKPFNFTQVTQVISEIVNRKVAPENVAV